jgi:hypothetical protein
MLRRNDGALLNTVIGQVFSVSMSPEIPWVFRSKRKIGVPGKTQANIGVMSPSDDREEWDRTPYAGLGGQLRVAPLRVIEVQQHSDFPTRDARKDCREIVAPVGSIMPTLAVPVG